MPGLKGASAEFIPDENIPHYPSEIIKMNLPATSSGVSC
jgi:hypothetical protein